LYITYRNYTFFGENVEFLYVKTHKKVKQSRYSPGVAQRVTERFPDYMTTAQDGGKVSLTHRPPLPPGNVPGTHFC
jgi:hypothetical protein